MADLNNNSRTFSKLLHKNKSALSHSNSDNGNVFQDRHTKQGRKKKFVQTHPLSKTFMLFIFKEFETT